MKRAKLCLLRWINAGKCSSNDGDAASALVTTADDEISVDTDKC